ncbi:MAG: MaoC/PaaZ C-terminal domain-containing protein [Woeseiaceae bacterium]|nr:MaoC/PaaZ C-terminal domain-containing protein [Woeseiaceae bacterium]
MPINYDELMSMSVLDEPYEYTETDSMLYALGVGFASDPMDRQELNYVADLHSLRTVPSMASMIVPAGLLDHCGWDRSKVLHSEQRLELYRPLPSAAKLLANHRVVGVYDLGADTGARILVESEARLARDETVLFSLLTILLARGDGGFGGPAGKPMTAVKLPQREPDLQCELATRPDQALLFRLSGDFNPLHADPAYARRAGFRAPILHGRCTYGVACHAILKTICEYDFTLIAGFDARFSAPVYPGDVITTEMWQERNIVHFRCRVAERSVTVIDVGRCTLAV